ncbi:hypothetical protein T484DRAFT_2027520, partial [Baffinella frigidus]
MPIQSERAGARKESTTLAYSALRCRLPSSIHRLLYAPLPFQSTGLPESPPSASQSQSVRQWQQGRSAWRQSAMRPLAEGSIASFYFSEELRLQLSQNSTGSRGNPTSSSKAGSTAGLPTMTCRAVESALAAVARSSAAAANSPTTPTSPIFCRADRTHHHAPNIA